MTSHNLQHSLVTAGRCITVECNHWTSNASCTQQVVHYNVTYVRWWSLTYNHSCRGKNPR
ncbi:hypothetical protein HOLleu_45038 [Holothuria leucospilota]|uniref:Uncharacterized protein n=1 Tax=Holothuria leucospilota TaxID=206669 RepID=A0A9Q1BAK2_HOLLE|nr:hypothetical protein HOLleu_45038 [Holothuria leucospilota]